MAVTPITLPDLTQAKVDGTGVFDTVMRAMVGHLEVEFSKGRLRGADYAQVYLSSLTPVLTNAVNFLLQKDEAANRAALVEAQVKLAEAQIKLVEVEILREQQNKLLIEAQIRKIDRDIQTSDLSDAYITQQTQNLVKQNLLTDEQIKQAIAETANTVITKDQIIAQTCLLKAQYDLTMLNKLQVTAQTSLIQQKQATERAQTVETGVDENSVIGRQKALYKAQSDGFERDAEQKAAKLLVDTWNVRRTTDSATVADSTNMLNDATIGRAMTKLLSGVKA